MAGQGEGQGKAPDGQEFGEVHLEYARQRIQSSRFGKLVGFGVDRLYAGGAVLSFVVDERHLQIHDVVHGGVIAALADTAAAIAAYTVSPEGSELVTVELKINYLVPLVDGRVEAEGRVLRVGRNFLVVECDVRNRQGALAAKALMTFAAAAPKRA